MTRDQFLQEAWQAAKESSKVSGLPPEVTVAQAALESAWGKSWLSRDANNYFGLKAYGSRPSVEMPTTECDCEGAHRVRARFARYESMQECFAERDRMILNSPYYAEARACRGDLKKFVKALAKHWATDPKYAEKLLGVIANLETPSCSNPVT